MNKLKSLLQLGVTLSVIFNAATASAWGKRGHQIIGENAALLVSTEPESQFMKSHSFDFGYYANVPDFIWKRPATYEIERNEHFMDIEIFHREFPKDSDKKKPFELSRAEFDTQFPGVTAKAGRAFWRIREMNDQLSAITEELRTLKEPTGAARQKIQERWMVMAGTMAHYIGDLSMPLHVSENYDGQMTNQKGIHSYFEERMVDELYPELGYEVHKAAKRQWPQFAKKNANKSLLDLLHDLSDRSIQAVPKLLAMDKKSKRDDVSKNARMYRSMLQDRLVDSTLVLAEVYRRQLGFKFDSNRFYFFAGEPEYIYPSNAKPKDKPARKK